MWPSWEAFERELPALGEPYFFSTKATRLLWDAPLGAPDDVVLVFGRETGGLPPEIHERYRDRFVAMPILSPRVRSLNLSTSVAHRGLRGASAAPGVKSQMRKKSSVALSDAARKQAVGAHCSITSRPTWMTRSAS